MATYKQIEQARETRLWVTQLGLPLLAATVCIIANPDVRRWLGDKVSKIKNKFGKKDKIEIEP